MVHPFGGAGLWYPRGQSAFPETVVVVVLMLGFPDGEASLEIIKFLAPSHANGIQDDAVNALGIRHVAFVVDDMEAVVAHLKQKGYEVFSEVQNYENIYKLCYCRGPEGIILDLAQEIE